MSIEDRDPLEQAARHVREGEERVVRQEALIAELERDGHTEAARRGREVLATLRRTLDLAREHWRLERASRGGREPEKG